MTLLPCPRCRRHVRADEARCPFCAGDLSLATQASATRVPRLPRAAMFLFAASTAVAGTAIAGCSSSDTAAPTPPADSGTDSAKDTAIVDTGAGTDSGADTAVTDSADTATDDTGGGTDAAKDSDGGPAPLYGAPPYP